MIIHHEKKWVLLTPPKTGSTSLHAVLTAKCGAIRTAAQHDMDLPKECKKYAVFGTTRLPYDRAVSLWWHRLHGLSKQNGKPPAALSETYTFLKFLEEAMHLEDFYRFGCHDWLKAAGKLDQHIPLENLAPCLRANGLLPSEVTLPRLNTTQHTHWNAYYGLKELKLTHARFAEDFKRYGYVKLLESAFRV